MKLATVLWTFVGLMLALFAYIASLAVVRGVTFLVLWGWFIAPLGLPDLNIWWALGLMTTVGLFFYQKNDPESAEFREAQGVNAKVGVMAGVLGHSILFCLLALMFGGFYHWMM